MFERHELLDHRQMPESQPSEEMPSGDTGRKSRNIGDIGKSRRAESSCYMGSANLTRTHCTIADEKLSASDTLVIYNCHKMRHE